MQFRAGLFLRLREEENKPHTAAPRERNLRQEHSERLDRAQKILLGPHT